MAKFDRNGNLLCTYNSVTEAGYKWDSKNKKLILKWIKPFEN